MPTILVVDDNDSIRRLVCKVAERGEYHCEEARDGVEAIELLRSAQHYEGIILDLMMPRANGFAVLDYLRNQAPDLLQSTIVLTADSTRWEDETLRETARVLKKPFSIDELLRAIDDAFDSASTPGV